MNVRIAFVLLGLGFLAAAASACGGGSKSDVRAQPPTANVYTPPTSEPFTPTVTPLFGWQSLLVGSVAHNARDAVGFAREVVEGSCPGICHPVVSAVHYVYTAKLDAWIIVAEGQFESYSSPAAYKTLPGTPEPVPHFMVVTIPNEKPGVTTVATNSPPDLSQYGDVHEAPLPLAKWPTPVTLAAQ